MKSIAFPAISTGVYGYPVEPAAEIAVTTVVEGAAPFDRVVFACFDQATHDIYDQLLPAAK